MTVEGEHGAGIWLDCRAIEAAAQGELQPPATRTQTKNRPAGNAVAREGVEVEVAAAVEGDRQAVERLLASILPVVVRYCRARVGRQERSFASADDVAQEVCLAVLTALPRYRHEGRPFLAFVYGIAAHKVADVHRAAARNRSELVPDVPDTPEIVAGPEQRALQGELSERMAQLLLILPEKHREIVVLRVIMGLSAEDTAEAVGSTPGAVRVAQHRALARLRRSLTGAGASEEAGTFGHTSSSPSRREKAPPGYVGG
jgi:RNA polymerase sigma-70 factor (ECF subfamily)